MVKGIVNAFDHMGFCLVSNLTTCTDGKWAVIWQRNFATKYTLVLLLTFTLGSKYLLRAKKLISNTERIH